MGVADRILPVEDFDSPSSTGLPNSGKADAVRGPAGSPPRPSEASDELTSNVAELPAVEGGAKFSMARKGEANTADNLSVIPNFQYSSVRSCGAKRHSSLNSKAIG